MTSLFSRYRSSNANNSASAKEANAKKDKDESPVEITPLEKMLQTTGPVEENDADKFFGLENFGNTCYCNSIVQALFYSEIFRDRVVNYPGPLSESNTKVEVKIRPPTVIPPPIVSKQKNNTGITLPVGGIRPEDRPDAPEYKKKQAMLKGPILELTKENTDSYTMNECTFTGLKDIFLALLQSKTRTGVLSPQRFLEIFKRDNEMFRNSMHQDAHEFYGIVLNDIITNLQDHERKMSEASAPEPVNARTLDASSQRSAANGAFDYGLVQDVFEGLLSSETKCLTCETVSQKNETFLDLSIDLDEHSSVTSCISKFSEEEMLCERNKFQCDSCGGLQEAEKRMKVQRLPKVMALHLKRFKYTEDFTRLQKLHHRVVYPSHLRFFNTTPQTRDPDRVYELYAVVVHIGGNAYHGHYVSVIKTKEWGWLLFDDEMVEPVDEDYVNNFFGDEDGLACAYVLFYQETTFETSRVTEEEDDSVTSQSTPEEESTPISSSVFTAENGFVNMTPSTGRSSINPVADDALPSLAHVRTAPISSEVFTPLENGHVYTAPNTTPTGLPTVVEDRKAEKKRLKMEKKQRDQEIAAVQAAEAERRKAEMAQQKQAREDMKKALDASKGKSELEPKLRKASTGGNLLDRASWSSKSMSRKSLNFLSSKKRDQEKDKSKVPDMPPTPTTLEPNSDTIPFPPAPSGPMPSVSNNNNNNNIIINENNASLPPLPPPPPPADTIASPVEKQDFRSRFSFSLGKKKSTPALS
ncbi:putative ubiquitin carboxyl-terminal hydrolase creB [Ceratocystis platani]|uniref:Ubiquitin carboxyl-terminal hydrolase n=1 Tax=Ceratocystis fimbriata f. sp. platani TaxID=88771 RepID=A0A0F8BPT8_CERFI|nr:putative ubiquitin carboxyl-terminal hydrolase creB [Ceratocystis platani]